MRIERTGRQRRDAVAHIFVARGAAARHQDQRRVAAHRDDRRGEADLHRDGRMGNAVHARSMLKTSPSKHSAPRPIDSTAATILPSRDKSESASATKCGLGVAEGESRRKVWRNLEFAARRQRAGGDEGRRRRAADPGVAMHDQRPRAVPGAHESQQGFDLIAARQHVALARRDNVGQAQNQMTLRRDASQARRLERRAEQRDDGAGAAVCHHLFEPAKRADDDPPHHSPRSKALNRSRNNFWACSELIGASRSSSGSGAMSGAPNRLFASSASKPA